MTINTVFASELVGIKELQDALKEFGINADKELAEIVKGTAQNIRSHAIKSIQRGPKTGTTYHRVAGEKYATIRAGGEDGSPVAFIPNADIAGKSATHKASAPGEAPATDTGGLWQSIDADIDGKTAEVVAKSEYAHLLEFGTQKMEARPFMLPAVEKESPKWEKRLQGVIDAAAKGIIK
jgi:HK97 gp10 family phage protein